MADNKFLSADIYGTNDYINAIKKRFIPDIPEDTLMLGIFGYMGQVFSDMMQNTIVMASELANESIPTKAKFEKNIIAHALGLGITDINAVPAQMDVLLTFIEDDITNWANAKDADGNELPWTFIFDKDTPIYIGDHCFHVDYDIEIKKIKLYHSGFDNKFTYTARYIMDTDNPISDITNPYLTAPVKMSVNGINALFTKCTLRQVTKQTIHKKVLSDNSIASKTTTFTFEAQLAAFTVDVTEGDKTTHLIPVYDGLTIDDEKYPYIYYTYLDTNTIRLKFDKESYMPRINSDVNINLQLTEGGNGNFIYKPDAYPGFSFESEKYGYSAIGCEIRPITGESSYGLDRKSVEELKKLIPKEALSRGSITSLADLQNYFNSVDSENSATYLYKKRDNALERLYYMYIIMRDKDGNIIPTNTVDIRANIAQLKTDGSNRLVLKKNSKIRLNSGDEYASVDSNTIKGTLFNYITPYNVVINTDPLYAMYYMPAVDTYKFLEFSYINENSACQYIATSIRLYRAYVHNDIYTMSLDIEQNVNVDPSMLIYNEDGKNIIGTTVRCIAVLYNDDGAPLRWAEAKFDGFIPHANIFSFKFELTTEDLIDDENRIRIQTGIYDIGSNTESYGYFSANTKCSIHILSKQEESYGLGDIANIVPDLEEYTLSNSYNVSDGIDFFYDYSHMVNSTVLIGRNSDGPTTVEDGGSTVSVSGPSGSTLSVPVGLTNLIIKNVPVIKYDYLDTEERVSSFCNELVRRKAYIEYLTDILEDLFGMDFKFFNTYGPSKLFTTDGNSSYLNSVNIILTFKLKLTPAYDTNIINDIIADVKRYIENINSIRSIHMTNLVSEISYKYRDSIEYFEFVNINGYNSSVQHIYKMDMPDKLVVPEFLNITTVKGHPAINIIIE